MFKKINSFLLIMMISFLGNNANAKYEKLAYDFKFKDLDGSPLNLSEYQNKVIVVVNVASQCGFTSQYEDILSTLIRNLRRAASKAAHPRG